MSGQRIDVRVVGTSAQSWRVRRRKLGRRAPRRVPSRGAETPNIVNASSSTSCETDHRHQAEAFSTRNQSHGSSDAFARLFADLRTFYAPLDPTNLKGTIQQPCAIASYETSQDGQATCSRAFQLQVIQGTPYPPLRRQLLHVHHRSKWLREVQFHGRDLIRARDQVIASTLDSPQGSCLPRPRTEAQQN